MSSVHNSMSPLVCTIQVSRLCWQWWSWSFNSIMKRMHVTVIYHLHIYLAQAKRYKTIKRCHQTIHFHISMTHLSRSADHVGRGGVLTQSGNGSVCVGPGVTWTAVMHNSHTIWLQVCHGSLGIDFGFQFCFKTNFSYSMKAFGHIGHGIR